jgi:ShK domain-like
MMYVDRDGNLFDPKSFKSKKEEPDFLVPRSLQPGEMQPVRWREDKSLSNLNPNPAVDGPDGETFLIGFPPELHEEFLTYIGNNGMMRVAHELLYKEEKLGKGEQRLYTLDDGEKWTAMVQGAWKTDMVWLDPGDESTFESLLGVLRRGGFDIVLDQIGKAFDLNGLMVQGVGAIFLSNYDQPKNIHVDIPGSRGSFYNIIVPVHIPAGHDAIFLLSDKGDDYKGQIKLDPHVGIVLGGESRHGTGKCNYRAKEDFRLSFAIYVADINEENVELIASDSTSLWPTDGDTNWFWAQRGRLWTKDGKNSLKNDKGRQPLNVQDLREDCSQQKDQCETDPKGVRLQCPKTCGLYLEDEEYYKRFFADRAEPMTCTSDDPDHPVCLNQYTSAM